jgi:hypothetical protein
LSFLKLLNLFCLLWIMIAEMYYCILSFGESYGYIYIDEDCTRWLEQYYINVREYRRDHVRETGNIAYTRRRQTKQKHNTICVGHHRSQTNTNNINKTWALLQTTGGKDDPNIILCEIVTDITSQNSERRDTILLKVSLSFSAFYRDAYDWLQTEYHCRVFYWWMTLECWILHAKTTNRKSTTYKLYRANLTKDGNRTSIHWLHIAKILLKVALSTMTPLPAKNYHTMSTTIISVDS